MQAVIRFLFPPVHAVRFPRERPHRPIRPRKRGGYDGYTVCAAIRVGACRDDHGIQKVITDLAPQPMQLFHVVVIDRAGEDYDIGLARQVSGVPTTFVNDVQVDGLLPIGQLQAIVTSKIQHGP